MELLIKSILPETGKQKHILTFTKFYPKLILSSYRIFFRSYHIIHMIISVIHILCTKYIVAYYPNN